MINIPKLGGGGGNHVTLLMCIAFHGLVPEEYTYGTNTTYEGSKLCEAWWRMKMLDRGLTFYHDIKIIRTLGCLHS